MRKQTTRTQLPEHKKASQTTSHTTPEPSYNITPNDSPNTHKPNRIHDSQAIHKHPEAHSTQPLTSAAQSTYT